MRGNILQVGFTRMIECRASSPEGRRLSVPLLSVAAMLGRLNTVPHVLLHRARWRAMGSSTSCPRWEGNREVSRPLRDVMIVLTRAKP